MTPRDVVKGFFAGALVVALCAGCVPHRCLADATYLDASHSDPIPYDPIPYWNPGSSDPKYWDTTFRPPKRLDVSPAQPAPPGWLRGDPGSAPPVRPLTPGVPRFDPARIPTFTPPRFDTPSMPRFSPPPRFDPPRFR